MRRRLFNIVAAVTLMMCVATAVLGVRSFYWMDTLECLSQAGRLVYLTSKNGRLDVLYIASWNHDPADRGFRYSGGSPAVYGGTDYNRRILGFGAGVLPNGGRFVNLPYWFLAIIFAVPSALAIHAESHRRIVARRLASASCLHCGYNLTGNVSGICPECGTVIPAKANAASSEIAG